MTYAIPPTANKHKAVHTKPRNLWYDETMMILILDQ